MADELLRQKSPTRVRFFIRDEENGAHHEILVPIDAEGFVRGSEVQRLSKKWNDAGIETIKYEDGAHMCRKMRVCFPPDGRKWEDCEFVATGSARDRSPTPKGKRGLTRKKVRIKYGSSRFWGNYHNKCDCEVEPAGYIPLEEIVEKTKGCEKVLYRLKGSKEDFSLEAPIEDIFLPHEAHQKGWGAFHDYTVVFE